MKNHIIFVFLLFNTIIVFGQTQEIEPQAIYTFKIGEGAQKVGEDRSPFGSHIGLFCNTNQYDKYVFMDYPNHQFLYFDLDFKYQTTIPSSLSYYGYDGFIDLYGNYYLKSWAIGGISKYTNDFKEIYSIQNPEFKNYSHYHHYDNHFILDQVIINPQGKILEGEARKLKLQEWREQSDYAKEKDLREVLFPFLEKEDLILCGNRLIYTVEKLRNENMVTYLKMIDDYYKKNKTSVLNQFSNKTIYIHSYDIHDNMYLYVHGKRGFVILNKYAKHIISFTPSLNNANISPNGDLIYLRGLTVSRIKNTWDPISNEEVDAWIEAQKNGSPVINTIDKNAKTDEPLHIKTLTTTSTLTEPNDKNAWLVGSSASCSPMQPGIEAVKGPGLGEYLEVELSTPITIDGIQIQPGCFWDTYW